MNIYRIFTFTIILGGVVWIFQDYGFVTDLLLALWILLTSWLVDDFFQWRGPIPLTNEIHEDVSRARSIYRKYLEDIYNGIRPFSEQELELGQEWFLDMNTDEVEESKNTEVPVERR